MNRSATIRVSILVTAVATLGLACLDAQAQSSDEAFRLAAGYYARGQWTDAEQSFRDLLQSSPEHPQAAEAQFFLAESLMESHRFQEALDVYRRFLTAHGNHHYAPRATFRMGESAFRCGNHDLAVRMLEEFIRSHTDDPLNEFALPYLGKLRNEREEFQLAQMAFEASLKLFPQGAMSNDARLGLAMALQAQGRFEEAKPFYEFLISQTDLNLADDSRIQLGIQDLQAADFEVAASRFETVVAESRDTLRQATAQYWLARTRLASGNSEEGLRMLHGLAATLDNEPILPHVLLDGAIAAIEQHEFKVALEWLERLRAGWPQSIQAREGLVWEIDLLRQQGRSDEAIGLARKHGTQAQQKQVATATAEINGRRQYQQHDFEAALETFQTLLEDRSHASAKRANWMYMLAMAQLGLNRFEEAEATLKGIDLEDASELAPLVEFSMASSLLSQKKFGPAIDRLDTYLQQTISAEQRYRAQLKLIVSLLGAQRWDRLANSLDQEFSDMPGSQELESVLVQVGEQAQQANQLELASAMWKRLQLPEMSPSIRDRAAVELANMQLDDGLPSGADESRTRDRVVAVVIQQADNSAVQQAAFSKAEAWLNQSRTDSAIAVWDAIAEHAADASLANRARYCAAQALRGTGQKDHLRQAEQRLIQYLEAAQSQDVPGIGDVKYQLGWLALDLGNPNSSMRWFQQVVEDHPECQYWADATYRLVTAAVSEGRWEGAERWIQLADQRNDLPKTIAIRLRLVAAQIATQNRDWDAAIAAAQQVLEDDPDGPAAVQARYWKAEAQFQLNLADLAQAEFQQLESAGQLSARQQAWTCLRLAQCAAHHSQWDRVEQRSRRAVVTWPDFEAIHEFEFLIGRCLEQSGRLTDARDRFQQVVSSPTGKDSATAAMAQWWIGETYFHQEDYVHAVQAYYLVDSLYDYPKWQSAALLQAGKSQEHLARPRQAVQLYSQLLKRFPDSEHVAMAKTRIALLSTTADGEASRSTDGATTRIGTASSNTRQ